MNGTLSLNGCKAILLRDEQNALDAYDSFSFNGCTILASHEMNAMLLAKSASYNGCNIETLDAPRNPVHVKGRIELNAAGAYAGKYLICDDLIIPSREGLSALEGMEGVFVWGAVYHPQSLEGEGLSKARAGSFVAYPDGAELLLDKRVRITAAELGRWQAGRQYYATGTIEAADAAALAELKERGVAFHCARLYIAEEARDACLPMFACGDVRVVPSGYAFAPEGMPLADLYATYGVKVYVAGDLTVLRREAKHLKLFESLVVKGEAELPLDFLAEAKRVMQADRFHVFEGELVKVNGFQTLGREGLKAALADFGGYTMKINGAVLLDEDVTAEDAKAFLSVKINGALLAPKATHAHFTGISKVNGVLLGSLSEVKAMLDALPEEGREAALAMAPQEARAMLGYAAKEEGSQNTSLNGATYVLM